MVELGRTASEFNTARMRESFLRQFIDQGPDATVCGISSGSDVTSGKEAAGMLAPAAPEGTKTIPSLLSVAAPWRSMANSVARQSGVGDIIR
jgi:hypothetical protein